MNGGYILAHIALQTNYFASLRTRGPVLAAECNEISENGAKNRNVYRLHAILAIVFEARAIGCSHSKNGAAALHSL